MWVPSIHYMSFVLLGFVSKRNTINLKSELFFLLHIWCNCCVKQLCSLRWLSLMVFFFRFSFRSYNDIILTVSTLILGHQIFGRIENNIHLQTGLISYPNLFDLSRIYLFVESYFRKLFFTKKKPFFLLIFIFNEIRKYSIVEWIPNL